MLSFNTNKTKVTWSY